jgi:pimeloyl-ACP methyl ester carboxylesterase
MTRTRRTTGQLQVLSSHGLTIRFRVHGEGDPLLLLNGLTRPQQSWGPFIKAMSGRSIITLDLPGVGGSPAPALPLSISVLASVAAEVLNEAEADRADVLGFSHGGAVAQQLAVQCPERVRGLVLAATSCGVGGTPGDQEIGRLSRQPADAGSWPRPDAVATMWYAMAVAGWTSIPYLGAIQAPTLVVCGERDRIVPPANSTLLARRIPGADLVLLAAGHDLQRTGPAAALAAAVDAFLLERCGQPVTVGK